MRIASGPEADLLATTLAVRQGEISATDALEAYVRIAEEGGERRFTWDGVKDKARLDSFFDPLGNLTVGQRARVEAARIYLSTGQGDEAETIRQALRQELASDLKQAQLDGYWPRYVAGIAR